MGSEYTVLFVREISELESKCWYYIANVKILFPHHVFLTSALLTICTHRLSIIKPFLQYKNEFIDEW